MATYPQVLDCMNVGEWDLSIGLLQKGVRVLGRRCNTMTDLATKRIIHKCVKDVLSIYVYHMGWEM